MPVFKISGKQVEKVKPAHFTGSNKEKQLQELIENNLDTMFDMQFVDTEYTTSHGGRIDTLALDRDNRPVIIEYKEDKSSTVLLQGLFYMDWLMENKAEFEKLVNHKINKDIDVNWKSGVRLVLIAKNFEIWDKFAVNRISEEVELHEYVLYENNELKLEKPTLPKDFRSKAKAFIPRSQKEYTVESQMKRIKNDAIREKVLQLREMIKEISDDIEERAIKDTIVYKSTINFAYLYPQTQQFWLNIKLPKSEVAEFADLDIRPHKDEVFTYLRCNEDTNLDTLLILAQRAYENTL
ncbi:DUF5655 domain-containing protein [Acidobacteriota bacterium]